MITVEQALELVERHSQPLPTRRVSLSEVVGLILAEDVKSDVDSPPYDKAMMDGYAVRSSDREPLRRVLEEVAAGAVPRRAITPGTASRVMTGAPLPDGADAVVPVEQTELVDAETVRLDSTDVEPGANVMPLGASLRAGSLVLRAGALLRPLEVGILAEMGKSTVPVHPRPRVAVLPTGNELVPVGERPAAGQIRNSNGPMILASLVQMGISAVDLGIARDDLNDLRQRIERGFAADVVLLIGGISAGKFDLVPGVLAELGAEQVFHKVALRPGKPLWFGVKSVDDRRVLIFGLPGNPVSTFVCYELFVRPAIEALKGFGFKGPQSATLPLAHSYQHAGGRAAFLPARVIFAPTTDAARGECPSVEILPWRGSGDLATLSSRANGLARLSAEPRRFEPGTPVDVLLI